MSAMTRARAQRVVLLAAKKAKNRFVKAMLREDLEARWLKRAIELHDQVVDKIAMSGLSDGDVDSEIANELLLLALNAVLKKDET